MKISEYIKPNVVSILETSTVQEAAAVFVKERVGHLPIVDEKKILVGVIGLRDLLSLVLPDTDNFVPEVDFVHDFGAVETARPSARVLDRSIQFLMKPPITVNEDTNLLRTYALMLQHNLHVIPVLSEKGQLVGMASRVDIGTAIVSNWSQVR